RALGSPVSGATSAIVAHHLLVASDMAEVFKVLGNDEARTVIVVSPNHFSRGMSRAQVSEESWDTVYGTVNADAPAVESLIDAVPFLTHDETAFAEEHGIYNLLPFVARSFPNAKIIPIILREELSLENAWTLGATLAKQFPDAALIASVDMTHYHDAEYTATNDQRVLDLIANEGRCNDAPCADVLDIDSNASMRVLFAWNAARGTTEFRLTHHGSSLSMGAAKDWHDNTSHILGYFVAP
ncbi:AmmeMemoRadiSam system protein B, partial [bacterium]|nr:AmmeMemoRadiSam system protein B [bacterium]